MSWRIWWPLGHQPRPDDIPIWRFNDPSLQAAVDIAEQAADQAQVKLDIARHNKANPDDLERLSALATTARLKYYEALNADLAR